MGDLGSRLDRALERAFVSLHDRDGPPGLGAALRYAVFPGGARLRPQLVLRVACALGDPEPQVADAAAVALELIHCAALAHDDLPCFDDADLRRGRPSVHKAFSEPTAVLVGDGLIVMAFQVLVSAEPSAPGRSAALVRALCHGTGHPRGIVAGQAWESEPGPSLISYHAAKTAALFEAACELGALAAGVDPSPWRAVGEYLGRAYQIADDLADATSTAAQIGKSVGQDAARHRPSAFASLGEEPCRELLEQLLHEASEVVPPCAGRGELQAWLAEMSLGVLRLRDAEPRKAGVAAAAPPSRNGASYASAPASHRPIAEAVRARRPEVP